MSEISLLGLGLMGGALGRALQAAGHQITVWNRSPEKTQPFVAAGAATAATAAEAIAASPIVLICIDNYDITRRLLETDEVAPHLAGRTLVQLSSGTPKEAHDSAAWLTSLGVDYIDGAILGGPDMIGTDHGLILFGGPEGAWRRSEPVLACLGGDLRYLGDNAGAAAALDLAWLCQRYGLFLGVVHGARLCESEGVGIDHYARLFPEGDRARGLAQIIHDQAFDSPTATLKVWDAALQRVRGQAQAAGITCEIPDFAASFFERAIAAGHGEEDVAALIKVLRENDES